MAKSKTQSSPAPTSIDHLGARLQKVINSPSAQKNREAVIYKAPDELQDDWNQIMEAIIETEGVHVTPLDDGGVRVHWDVPSTN
ncbi:DUF1654 domain-containing protein [Pseudomonas ovata]|uniref:DUF1654 domain-containing protein n=1 Tax=Pseudomonas ovata TaxID=1839709 RepID=UPI000D69B588|nr:DUF1654 domain-containing protein [Pseudomonas ovata]